MDCKNSEHLPALECAKQNQHQRLIIILENKKWYSYSFDTLCHELNVSVKQLHAWVRKEHEKVHVFRFPPTTGVQYVGLEACPKNY